MSLIDEALKRARMEAAQKAAEGEGLPYPAIPRHLAPRRRRGWLAPAIVAVAVAAGLLIGWAMASRGPHGEQAASRGGDGTGAGPVTSGPATPAGVARDPLPAGTGGEPAAPPPSGSPPSEPAPPGPVQSDPAPSAPPPGEESVASPTALERQAAQPITSGPARPSEVTRDPRPVVPPPAPTAPRQADEPPPAAPSARPAPDGPSADEPEAPTSAGNQPATPPADPTRAATPDDEPVGAEPVDARTEESVSDRSAQPTADRRPRPGTQAPAATALTDPDSGLLLVLPDQPAEADPEAPAAAAAESYVQTYPLPGGGTIELGGIAWSETGPFALLNGRVVGPGAVIQEYTLERIRPGHVELAGDGRRIHLSLQ